MLLKESINGFLLKKKILNQFISHQRSIKFLSHVYDEFKIFSYLFTFALF